MPRLDEWSWLSELKRLDALTVVNQGKQAIGMLVPSEQMLLKSCPDAFGFNFSLEVEKIVRVVRLFAKMRLEHISVRKSSDQLFINGVALSLV